jgi:hypothetical protein
MPMNAKKHPKIEELVNFLDRNILENIAVVIMTPPLEICQTEPAIKFNEIYANIDAIVSNNPGIIGMYHGQ